MMHRSHTHAWRGLGHIILKLSLKMVLLVHPDHINHNLVVLKAFSCCFCLFPHLVYTGLSYISQFHLFIWPTNMSWLESRLWFKIYWRYWQRSKYIKYIYSPPSKINGLILRLYVPNLSKHACDFDASSYHDHVQPSV
jgi:hypothetical protein